MKYLAPFFCGLLLLLNYSSYAQQEQTTAVDLLAKANEMIAQDDFSNAFEPLKKCIALDSNIRGAYIKLASTGMKEEKYAETEAYLKKGLRIFPEDDEFSFYLGYVLQKQNQFGEAIEAYSDAISWSKKESLYFLLVYSYYSHRGNCYLKTGKPELALIDLNVSLEINQNNANTLVSRGLAFAALKNHEKACKDWQKALKLGNKEAQSFLEKYCE